MMVVRKLGVFSMNGSSDSNGLGRRISCLQGFECAASAATVGTSLRPSLPYLFYDLMRTVTPFSGSSPVDYQFSSKPDRLC